MAVWFDTSDAAFSACLVSPTSSINVFSHVDTCAALYHLVHAFFKTPSLVMSPVLYPPLAPKLASAIVGKL